MACPCKHKSVIDKQVTEDGIVKTYFKEVPEAVAEALDNDLDQCYLCAKKHVERAKVLFEEVYLGYDEHRKNLIESLKVAEEDVRNAFLTWQHIMGHLDQAACELLGKKINTVQMNAEHVELATKIRSERMRLSEDPLYVPDFDNLLVAIHLLQHETND